MGRSAALFPQIVRDEVPQRMERCLRPGRPWQPDILLLCAGDARVVLKDYAMKAPIIRLLGRIQNRREEKIYRLLHGIEGVPRCLGRIDPHGLMIEYIPARPACQAPGELDAEFFKRLKAIVAAIHARGVALCDMRNTKNILLGEDRRPYLVDFSTAIRRGRWWNPFTRALFRVFSQDDFMGILKLKRQAAPDLLQEAEARRLRDGLPFERTVKRVRDGVVRVLRRWLRGVERA